VKNTMLTCLIFFMITFSLVSSAEPILYVVTGPNNTMLAIDTQKDEIMSEIGELENAHGLAGNKNTPYLVAGSLSKSENINTKENLASKPITMSDDAHKRHHTAAGDEKGNTGKSYVSIIHPEHGHVMNRIEVVGITHHTAVSPDGKVAIAAHSQNGGVSVIDLNQSKVITFIKTGQVPNFVVFNDGGQFAYVTNSGSGSISVIDTKKWSVIKDIKVGSGPAHLFLDKPTNVLYVVNVLGGSVSAINLTDKKIVSTYQVGKSPHGISMSSDGKWLFVSNKGSDTLTRINIRNGNVKNLTLKPAPYHLEVIPNSRKLYVSSRKQAKIWVIDQLAMNILKEINIGFGVAHQMVLISR